jgi:hypothetical protein
VDDVVVKTRNSSTLIDGLEETFASLREYRWKLNPNMCVFGVPSGKLLCFIISHRGIEANPEKISAVTSMKAPTSIKDVQKLTGCMAALNRFISKLGERGLCRMDLPGPTTSVGTRTDYSVGPWDYPACATRHLKAWSTRTTQE